MTWLWFLWTGVIPKALLALPHGAVLLLGAYGLLLLCTAGLWYGRERAEEVPTIHASGEEKRLAA